MSRPTDSDYMAAARRLYQRDGEIEVDAFAKVSASDGGAYVEAWVWVPDEAATPEARP